MRKQPAASSQQPASEYQPMVFSEGCELTASEREAIETQRKDLWKHGIRKQPMLDQMAFEFGYVICASRAAKEASEHGG